MVTCIECGGRRARPIYETVEYYVFGEAATGGYPPRVEHDEVEVRRERCCTCLGTGRITPELRREIVEHDARIASKLEVE
jgi:hypothetical protein